MSNRYWNEVRGLSAEIDPGEQFIESSKLGLHDEFPSQEAVIERMQELLQSLPYDGYPATKLPPPATIGAALSSVIDMRVSARHMQPQQIELTQLAALLHAADGITRTNEGTGFVAPFRTVPSGGGLFPLEVYFFTKRVTGLTPGLYHYNPTLSEVRLVREGDLTPLVAEALVPFQANVAYDSSAIFFLTAIFERSTFKYGQRGYRFVLLEAGHMAQNLNLAATGLDLGVLSVGGYYDRVADRLLGIDGVTHTTVYMVAVSRRLAGPPGEA